MRNKKTLELEKYEKKLNLSPNIIEEAQESKDVSIIALSHSDGSSDVILKINCFVDRKEDVFDRKGYSKLVFE